MENRPKVLTDGVRCNRECKYYVGGEDVDVTSYKAICILFSEVLTMYNGVGVRCRGCFESFDIGGEE